MNKMRKIIVLLIMLVGGLFTLSTLAKANETITLTFKAEETIGELALLRASNIPSDSIHPKGVSMHYIVTPYSPNYNFLGWYYQEDDQEKKLYKYDQFFEDTIFYAKWEKTLRVLKYELYGGINHPDNPNEFYGTDQYILKDPTKTEFLFMGWYDNPHFIGDPITEIGDGSVSMTLHAKWITANFYVSFDINYLEGETIDTQTVGYLENAIEPEVENREGYIFDGWYLNSRLYDFSDEVTENLTLVAHWRAIYYTVLFKDIDGTILKMQTVKHGSDAVAPINPTKTGYSFVGWDLQYENVKEDLVLTAEYEANTYNVTFDINEGDSEHPSSIEVTYDSNYNNLPADPTRLGYRFDGWYTSAGVEITSQSAVEVAEDHTLYASWFKLGTTNEFKADFEQKITSINYDGLTIRKENEDILFGFNDTMDPALVFDAIAELINIFKSYANDTSTLTLDSQQYLLKDEDILTLGSILLDGKSIEEFLNTKHPLQTIYEASLEYREIEVESIEGQIVFVVIGTTEGLVKELRALVEDLSELENAEEIDEKVEINLVYEDEEMDLIIKFFERGDGLDIDLIQEVAMHFIYKLREITSDTSMLTFGEDIEYTLGDVNEESLKGLASDLLAAAGVGGVQGFLEEGKISIPYTATTDYRFRDGSLFAELDNLIIDGDLTFQIQGTEEGFYSAITEAIRTNQNYQIEEGKLNAYLEESHFHLGRFIDFLITIREIEIVSDLFITLENQDGDTLVIDLANSENFTENPKFVSLEITSFITGVAIEELEDINLASMKFSNIRYIDYTFNLNYFSEPIVFIGTLTFSSTVNIEYQAGENGRVEGLTLTQNIPLGNNGREVTAVPNNGYRFDSWSDGSTENPRTDLNVLGHDRIITANFVKEEYIITFDSDGGSEVASITGRWNEAIVEPDSPTKEGYTFAGWYLDENLYNFNQNITGPFTLVAKWTVNQYTLTFNSNGGTLVNQITLDYNSNVIEPNAPTKIGYDFVGWSPEVPNVMPAENLTFEALWELKEFEIEITGYSGAVTYPNKINLDVTHNSELDQTFTYEWYKGEQKISNNKELEIDGVFNSGTYKIVVTLENDGNSLVVEKELEVVINKGQHNISPIFEDKTYTYDGLEKELLVTNLPAGVTPVYENNKLTNVGEVIVTVRFLVDSNNYEEIDLVLSKTLKIVHQEVTITPNINQSKVYGDNDPELTYTLSKDIEVTGELSRENNNSNEVGNYLINLGSLTPVNENYKLVIAEEYFEIKQKALTITAESKMKVYGEDDPELTYTVEGLEAGDSLTVELERVVGENVNEYQINLKSHDASNNYNVVFNEANLEITPKDLFVTPHHNQDKTYGDNDPIIAYDYNGLLLNDNLEVVLTREDNQIQDVGSYKIIVESYSITNNDNNIKDNYNFIFTEGIIFKINKKQIVVIPNSVILEFGENEPNEYTYTTHPNLPYGEQLQGSLAREESSNFNVGVYSIVQNTLTNNNNSNYDIVFVQGSTLTINPKKIIVTPNSNQHKFFEKEEPVLEYELSEYIDVEGTLAREPGETVGIYLINLGSLVATDNNYQLVLSENIKYFQIKEGNLENLEFDSHTHIFNNDEYVFSIKGVDTEDESIEITYVYDSVPSNEPFEFKDVGSYTVSVSASKPGYAPVYFVATLTIVPFEIILTPQASQSKIYGDNDPVLEYFLNQEKLNGDSLTEKIDGLLIRENGETVGEYDILFESITLNDNSGNYILTFVEEQFEIKKATYDMSSVSFDAADYTYDGLEKELVITGSLPDDVSVNYENNKLTDVGSKLATAIFTGDSTNYNLISNMTATLEITPKAITATQDGNLTYTGSALAPEFNIFGLIEADIGKVIVVLKEDLITANGGNEQTLEVELIGDRAFNYTIGTVKVTVDKATYDMSSVSFDNADYIYDGLEKELVITGSLPDDVSVDYENNKLTDVGSKLATAIFTGDSTNYNLISNMTATLEITPKAITATQKETLEYTGSTLIPEFTIDGLMGSDDVSVELENELINANNGEVQLLDVVLTGSKAGNYKIGKVEITVKQKELVVEQDGSLTYTGSALTPEFTIDGLLDGDVVNVELKEELINANYGNSQLLDVVLTGSEAENYSIGKVEIIVETILLEAKQDGNLTYTGSALTPELIITGLLDGDEVNVELENELINANNGNVQLLNLVLSGSEAENYRIEQVEITVETILLEATQDDNYNLTYTGSALTPELIITGLLGGDEVNVELENELINANNGEVQSLDLVLSGAEAENYSIGKVNIVVNKADYNMDNISFNNISLIYNANEQEILISGDLPQGVSVSYENNTLTDVGSTTATANFIVADESNYNSIVSMQATLTITKATPTFETGKMTGVYPVVEEDYTDNAIKSYDTSDKESEFIVKFNDVVIDDVSYTYDIDTIDLSNGASTFIVKVTVEGANVKGAFDVVYKFKSVTIGNNNTYYTIEDALNASGTEDRIIKYNTSFAEIDVAKIVYKYAYDSEQEVYKMNYDLGASTKLILPFDQSDSDKVNEDAKEAGLAKVNRVTGPYVELTITQHVNLNIKGRLTVNSKISSNNPTEGYVADKYYSQIKMLDNSRIFVENNGVLVVNGFIYGEGKINTEENAKIYERLVVTDYRGGTATNKVYGEVFPFDQFTINSILVELTVNKGAMLFGKATFYIPTLLKRFTDTYDVRFIGVNNNLLNLKSADSKVIKTFNEENGNITFDFYGEIKLQNVDVKIAAGFAAVDATTADKEFPFPGNFTLNIKEDAKILIDLGIKLLPGSEVNIEEGSEVTVSSDSRIVVYGSDDYVAHKEYPASNSATVYRKNTTLDYEINESAVLNNNGLLIIDGDIAGIVTSSENAGIIIFNEGVLTSLTINNVVGAGGNAVVGDQSFQLKNNLEMDITIIQGKYNIYKDAQWTIDLTFYKDGLEPKEITQTYGETIKLPDWENIVWVNEEGNLLEIDENYLINIIEFKDIYAVEIELKTINFESNGGSQVESLEIETFDYFDPDSEQYTPEREDYVFIGWYTDGDLNEPYDKSLPIMFNMTLYAKWIYSKITVSFNSNGGSEIPNEIVDYDTTVEEPMDPIKEDYIFIGWYLNDVPFDFNTKVEEEIELLAIWTSNIYLSISADKDEPDNGSEVKITIKVTIDGYITLEGVTINLTVDPKDGATLGKDELTTDENGIATTTFKGTKEKETSYTIKATALWYDLEDIVDEVKVKVKEKESGNNSPFIYSESEDGNIFFEHEPFPFSMIKAVEGTTYGTLRLIQDQNGIYYIQVIEEGTSTTALNNVEMFAIDYEANKGVIDAMFDMYGNPHTIKERISPIEFIDQFGISHLDKVLDKDGNYANVNSEEDLISYFIATFERTEDMNRYAKLMITAREIGNTLDVLMPILAEINGIDNLWWLDQAFLNNLEHQQAVQNVFDAVTKLYVEVWDGENWINVGSIDPGTYITQEFLVEIDLLNIHTEDIKVRLLFPSMINYAIDSIYIDYSENVNMIVHKLELVDAKFNNQIDILDLVSEIDSNYVYLDYKDSARLGFEYIELADGYERFIGVSATGYIYAEGSRIEDEDIPDLSGKTFEEIKDIIMASNKEEYIVFADAVEELFYTMIIMGELEYMEILYAIQMMFSEE